MNSDLKVTITQSTITSYSWKCECGQESMFRFEHGDEAIKAWRHHVKEDHR